MFCENCGTELPDGAVFCSNCGKRVNVKAKNNNKNIYIALILTFFITGLGSVYAGNAKKGLILFIVRILFAIIGLFISLFIILSFLVWAYAFYEAYKDVQITNGHANPNLISDFKDLDQSRQILAIVFVCLILAFVIGGCVTLSTVNDYSSGGSGSHYYSSGSGSHYYTSGSGVGSSGSSHYGGVDTSPGTIAKNNPDWYYDYYEYGDNPDIDDYLESDGYD